MKQIAELFANDPSNMMESRKEVCVHLMMFVCLSRSCDPGRL